jgi:hypothetical protein
MSGRKSFLADYIKDLELLSALPASKRHDALWLEEYPFDLQLLTASRIYRESRRQYLDLGGVFAPRISSTMRSLSAQDLFADLIDYTPSSTELEWFRDRHVEVAAPEEEIVALSRFNEISLFHEQNHRVIWRLLPPVPSEQRDVGRYLNFAESLVVMLDLALGDELGAKVSAVAERMKVIYRTGRDSRWKKRGKSVYRQYLLAIQCATYFVLEMINPEDVLAAVDYVFPGQKAMNKEAVARSLDINELFTRVTNPEWQKREWKESRRKLVGLQGVAKTEPLYLPEDPLDLEDEFVVTRRLLAAFGL